MPLLLPRSRDTEGEHTNLRFDPRRGRRGSNRRFVCITFGVLLRRSMQKGIKSSFFAQRALNLRFVTKVIKARFCKQNVDLYTTLIFGARKGLDLYGFTFGVEIALS